eukprot:7569774-Alexandrium_andersonii.AAC.1
MTVYAKPSRKRKHQRRARAAPSWQQGEACGRDVTYAHQRERDRARLVAESCCRPCGLSSGRSSWPGKKSMLEMINPAAYHQQPKPAPRFTQTL